jgi:hypothetical protein
VSVVAVDGDDVAVVLAGTLGQPNQAGEGVEGVAADEEVVGGAGFIRGNLADDARVVLLPDLGNVVVLGRDPLVGAVLVGEEAEVLVGPGELETALVGWHGGNLGGWGRVAVVVVGGRIAEERGKRVGGFQNGLPNHRAIFATAGPEAGRSKQRPYISCYRYVRKMVYDVGRERGDRDAAIFSDESSSSKSAIARIQLPVP